MSNADQKLAAFKVFVLHAKKKVLATDLSYQSQIPFTLKDAGEGAQDCIPYHTVTT